MRTLITRRRPFRVLLTALPILVFSAAPLGGCSTDQVFDTTRYWGDRLAGATLDADPSRD